MSRASRQSQFAIFRRITALAAFAASAIAGGALAHHSFAAEFDRNAQIRLEGRVTKFEWVNPHSWIHVAVQTDHGIEEWRIEAGTPAAMRRRGWERDSLPPGTRVLVNAFRARDGSRRASAATIGFPNGRQVSLGNPTAEAVVAATRHSRLP
ncbi:DUF6152 family protein [Aurantiacibacter spongiae]|uniref:Uncharacterized protein n=1 Tax=Aurantiacibacter spongiae TaxID=2488860 RepID=A0A3N5CRF6_9SPHN|nr:DUF6152 family protein [Aurantiacibacter spongiae]RPF70916.1 hypothetical protein EG799_04240 [Aurantiacibacter spongiae]